MTIASRSQFGHLLTSLGLTGEACEIGVANGDFSFQLLDCWPGKVHMIDCWENQDQAEYLDSFNTGNDGQDVRYHNVLNRAMGYGARAAIHKAYSRDAAAHFTEGQFCFVYIDANHKYEAISEDLRLWSPKVRSGGVLAGHDYLDGVLPSGDYGVKRAVDELASRIGRSVNVVNEEWPSWFILLP